MIVFVHGVPETAAIWGSLRSRLDADSVALSLPGFGCARPSGFGATKEEYVQWLVQSLAAFDEPVDLVGHDWGAGLTYRVATAHGELLRSWCADIGAIMHPNYVWHDFARIWQTPGDGEAFFQNQQSLAAEERGAVYEMFGVGHEDAVAMGDATDETMGTCILNLYRSATPNPYTNWGADFAPTHAPGMVLFPTEDPFDDEGASLEVATMLGARHTRLEGLSHWWPLQDPRRGAEVVHEFIRSVH